MNTTKVNDIVNIKYNAGIYVSAGWRSVCFEATAKMISNKRCEVIEVIAIDGEPVTNNMSRTGAKRQSFYGVGVAKREVGKVKIVSKLNYCELMK